MSSDRTVKRRKGVLLPGFLRGSYRCVCGFPGCKKANNVLFGADFEAKASLLRRGWYQDERGLLCCPAHVKGSDGEIAEEMARSMAAQLAKEEEEEEAMLREQREAERESRNGRRALRGSCPEASGPAFVRQRTPGGGGSRVTGPREPYAGEAIPEISPQVLAELNYLLRKARKKYGPLEDNFRLLGAMRLEYKEVEQAIQAREDWHVRAELLDLANVCIRRVLEMDAASKTKTPTPKESEP